MKKPAKKAAKKTAKLPKKAPGRSADAMPINILMPALSPTMEKGNLAKWLKKEGDTVKSGDIIAEIETDKATMEVEAVDEGTIAKIVVPEGTADVPVNQVIAVLAGEGEDVKSAAAGAAKARAAQALPRPKPQAARAPQSVKPTPRPRQPRRARGSAPAAPAAKSASAAGQAVLIGRPHLRLAAGQAAGQGSRHRPVAHPRLRPARPHHPARRGRRQIRQGPEARRRAAAPRPRLPASRRRCRTSRSARCSRTAATRWCRTTACAAPSRNG